MSLTETMFWTKRIGIGIIAAFLLFIPLRLIWIIAENSNEIRERQTELPYASYGFGPLPEISLTSLSLAPGSVPTYQLETPAGEFPEVPPVVHVYKIKEKIQSLTALDEAKELANDLGFKVEPSKITNTSQYRWTDGSGRILTIDLSTQNFQLTTDFSKDSFKDSSFTVPDLTKAESIVLNFLKGKNLTDASYETDGYLNSTYLKADSNGEYLIANSLSEAEFVRVDLYREFPLIVLSEEEADLLDDYLKGKVELDEEDVPKEYRTAVKTPSVIKGNISLIIRHTSLSSPGAIYDFNYNFWEVDTLTSETYYTRTPAEAWEDVQNGQAYLRYLVDKEGEPYKTYTPIDVDQFLVYDISLVYLETAETSDYLQPIYMIRGEARSTNTTGKPDLDFVYYTKAIVNY